MRLDCWCADGGPCSQFSDDQSDVLSQSVSSLLPDHALTTGPTQLLAGIKPP